MTNHHGISLGSYEDIQVDGLLSSPAFNAKNPEEVKHWLEGHKEVYCVPGNLMGPDLTTRVRKIRYEAIKISWLKRWWCPEPDRPDWAWVANDLVFKSAQQKPAITQETVSEWVCQSWPIKTRSECLPNSLKEMVEAAQKYNVTISVMRARSAKTK